MEVVGTIAILYLTSTYKKQDLLTLTIYWGGAFRTYRTYRYPRWGR